MSYGDELRKLTSDYYEEQKRKEAELKAKLEAEIRAKIEEEARLEAEKKRKEALERLRNEVKDFTCLCNNVAATLMARCEEAARLGKREYRGRCEYTYEAPGLGGMYAKTDSVRFSCYNKYEAPNPEENCFDDIQPFKKQLFQLLSKEGFISISIMEQKEQIHSAQIYGFSCDEYHMEVTVAW